ncbi:MAG: hypothetical protein Q9227_008793 [Pyrenula ochraceoflavens]
MRSAAVLRSATRAHINPTSQHSLLTVRSPWTSQRRAQFLSLQKPPYLYPIRYIHDSPPRCNLHDVFFGQSAPIEKVSAHRILLQNYGAELDQLKASDPTFYGILHEGHPERVLHALLGPVSNSFYQNTSQALFEAVLVLIDPDYFIQPFKQIYRYIKPSLIEGSNEIRSIKAPELEFDAFTRHLDQIVRRRKDAGYSLSLGVYRHLLACADALADDRMADLVWRSLTSECDEQPDVACYASLMGAKCWADSWRKNKQFNFRVLDASSIQNQEGHTDDLAESRVRQGQDLRRVVLSIFEQLVFQGLEGNEAVFAHLMTAMGREGDIEGVKSLLKSVWRIDLDLMQRWDEEELETPSHHNFDSPLRPTNQLLFTIAHVFGSNDRVETAMQLVDFVSRQYNISIAIETWQQIIEWGYVLQRRGTSVNRRRGLAARSTQHNNFYQYWESMTNPPHNVKPSVALLTYKVAVYAQNRNYEGSVRELKEARNTLMKTHSQLSNAITKLLDTCSQLREQFGARAGGSIIAAPSKDVENLESSMTLPSVAPPSKSSFTSDGADPTTERLDEPRLGNGRIVSSPGFESVLGTTSTIFDQNAILPAYFFDARRSFLFSSLLFDQHLQLLTLSLRRLTQLKYIPWELRARFERQFLPKLIGEWTDFLPTRVSYWPVRSVNENGDSTGYVVLHLKDERMKALQHKWNSTQWGKNLDKELFTTTNARIRRVAQVDSHEELVDLCQILSPEWLQEFAYTRSERSIDRKGERQEFLVSWRNDPGLSERLARLSKEERELILKRYIGERRRERGLEEGSIAQNKTALRGPPRPDYPMYVR